MGIVCDSEDERGTGGVAECEDTTSKSITSKDFAQDFRFQMEQLV